jgi:hypothetical protein
MPAIVRRHNRRLTDEFKAVASVELTQSRCGTTWSVSPVAAAAGAEMREFVLYEVVMAASPPAGE